MKRTQFWYILCESRELGVGQVLARRVLNEWIALFRDAEGRAVALQDRCLHRSSQLSRGRVIAGELRCPYHGWTYDGAGTVVRIPSEGPERPKGRRCATRFDVVERDDYVYVRLEPSDASPFAMPSFRAKGYTTIRLQNTFRNSVTNCVENFVDVPHTTFVHPGIFRDPGMEEIAATVERDQGRVRVTYEGEKQNFGLFTRFLNGRGREVRHTDEFVMPNVTTVNYWFGAKHFIITSQSVPVSETETRVYTDLTYDYGIWTWPSRALVRRHAQAIIDQDIDVLDNQQKTIARYGARFQNSPADVIHTFIESIQNEIENDRDPLALPRKDMRIGFWL